MILTVLKFPFLLNLTFLPHLNRYIRRMRLWKAESHSLFSLQTFIHLPSANTGTSNERIPEIAGHLLSKCPVMLSLSSLHFLSVLPICITIPLFFLKTSFFQCNFLSFYTDGKTLIFFSSFFLPLQPLPSPPHSLIAYNTAPRTCINFAAFIFEIIFCILY